MIHNHTKNIKNSTSTRTFRPVLTRITSIILVASMMFCLVSVSGAGATDALPAAGAAGFYDISESSSAWAITRALNAGIIQFGTGYFRPDDYITRAEIAEIICAFVPLGGSGGAGYTDLSGSESYAAALAAVCESGYLYRPSDGSITPNGYASREEAASLFYKIFSLPAGSGALPGALDSGSISYTAAVSSLYTAGYFPASMVSGQWFSPKMAVTRAEFVEILMNIITFFAGREQYTGAVISGNVYAGSDDAIPAGLTATGTIYIGKSAQSKVAGRTYLTSYWNTENVKNVNLTQSIGTYTTYFIAGSSGRNTNIALAASYINGTILLPGEEFSFNKTVGIRSAERGFQYANIFVGSEKVPGLGGGVCQVSSTLFCAAMFSAQTITSRTQHSMKVDYSFAGYDATVSYGSIDFKFRNDIDVPVKIGLEANTASGYITASIFAPDTYVKPEVEVDVTLSGSTYTTTRFVNGAANFTTKSNYIK